MKFNEIYIPEDQIDSTKKKIMNAVKKDEASGCWNLTKYFHHGKKDGKFSYCKMSINVDGVRNHYFVHRLSYYIFVGKIPKDRLILHKCHNYKCINPDHLYVGNQRQNMIDCKNAGRENKAIGERNKKAKLKTQDIKKIFILHDMGFSTYEIARLYKLAPNNIGRILRRESWKHIQVNENEDDLLRLRADTFSKEGD